MLLSGPLFVSLTRPTHKRYVFLNNSNRCPAIKYSEPFVDNSPEFSSPRETCIVTLEYPPRTDAAGSPDPFMKKTLVVIPHYGSDSLLAELFASIGVAFSSVRPGSEVTSFESADPDVLLLVVNNNELNRGFTAACNLGLAHLDGSHGFVWFLNNDTVFDSPVQFSQSLHRMQQLSEERGWGLVGQQVRNYSFRDQIVFGGARACFPAGQHKSGSCRRGDWQFPEPQTWLSFCSVLLKAEVVDQIGTLDESFINYYSDSDYSLRVRAGGHQIGYAGCDSYVYHKIGSSAQPSGDQKVILLQDYRSFWSKWITGPAHRLYLELMNDRSLVAPEVSREFTRVEAMLGAREFPEIERWLSTLPSRMELTLDDVLQHFLHSPRVTPTTILCNVTQNLRERYRS